MDNYQTNHQSYTFSQQTPKKIDYDLEEAKKIMAQATEEIRRDLWKKWQKTYADAEIFPSAISRLNQAMRDVLLSFENTVLYDSLAEKFKLNPSQRDFLPQLIWGSAIKNNFGDLENSLQLKMNLPPELAQQIFNELNQKIISKISTARDVFSNNQASKQKILLPLDEALKKYPEIGEEIITDGMLQLPNSESPVRPSIKNWLMDYFSNIGNEKHDAMQRSAYIFQSYNGKNLSSDDRQKLSFILKAADEKSPLEIDADSKKIIFPKVEKSSSSQRLIQSTPLSSSTAKIFSQSNILPKFSQPKKSLVSSNSLSSENEPSSSQRQIPLEKNKEKSDNFDMQHNIQRATFSSPQKIIQEKPTNFPRPLPASPKPLRLNDKPTPTPTSANSKPDAKPLTQPTAKNPNFSEELKKIKEKLSQQKSGPKPVNVINLKDLV